MAVLEINGDFSIEKEKSNSRFASAEGAIGTIDQQLTVLRAAWQDEKSTDMIQSIEDYVTDMKSKLSSAKTETDDTFVALKDCIDIYK